MYGLIQWSFSNCNISFFTKTNGAFKSGYEKDMKNKLLFSRLNF